ncbi:hypothetical protein I4U23_015355 [Adineta vaga]|nr:hypothetical protein I4U23_015355 [Adineta vaga]
MHGVPGIARSESIHNRIFWSISFISFTIVMIYFVVKSILSYYEYPTQIDINIIREWPQYFPAVSICNAGPFRLDRFLEAFYNYTDRINATNTNNRSELPLSMVDYIGSFVIDSINANQSLNPYFYSLSSMLYTCRFNSYPCTIDNFISFISVTHGLCHTFNAKMKNETNENYVRYGNEHGGNGLLEMEFYVHSHQYIPYYWTGVGMVALVHDNTQLPSIETAGIYLNPGHKHKLGYKKKTTSLLSPPYTTCTDRVSLSMKIMYENYYNGADYGYTQSICQQLCEQTYAYEKCGCISPYLWNARSLVLPSTKKTVQAPVCKYIHSNPCYDRAVDELLSSTDLQEKYCSDCSTECLISEFLIQKSALESPVEWQMNGIKAFVEKSTVPLPTDWSTNWENHIKKNYLALSIVRETTVVEENKQSAQLTIVDVLSNIGGQTGLWIGISFLSVMEFIEMLYRLIRHQYYLIRFKLQERKHIAPEEIM